MLFAIGQIPPFNFQNTEIHAPANTSFQEIFTADQQEESGLEERLFAVHTTRHLPTDNVVKAGFLSSDPPSHLRSTLHFSLGEMVRPVEGVISWEDCPYAVVSPLRSLIPQAINLNTYDTFILGDFQLTPDSILVIPYCTPVPPTNAQIHFYNPQTQTLREAVDKVIALKKGFPIRMLETDDEDCLKPAYLNGININTPEFFAPLMRKYPYLSLGLRFDSFSGGAYRLGVIEQNLLFYHMSRSGQIEHSYSLTSLKILRTLIVHHMHCFIKEMREKKFPSMEAFKESKKEIFYWIDVLDSEISLLEKGDNFSDTVSSNEEINSSLVHAIRNFSLEEAKQFVLSFHWPYSREIVWMTYSWERYLRPFTSQADISGIEDAALLSLMRRMWPLLKNTHEGALVLEQIKGRAEYILACSDSSSALRDKATRLLRIVKE